MRAPRLHGEIRRDQIVRAVLAVAAEQGLGALSVAAVARRVGVAPSALYRHYPSKDAMLDDTIARFGARVLANVGRARAGAAGPLDAIRRLLVLHVDLVREHRGIPMLLFSEETFHHPVRRARLLGFMRRFRGEIAELVREAQAGGQVRAQLDPESVAVQFFGLFQPAAILWHLAGGRFDMTGQARRAWEIFRDGIATPGAPAPRARARRRSGTQEKSA